MKKRLLLSLVLFISGLISAQVYPKLKKEAANLDQFIPKGWKLMGSVNGDINKDGITDYVFILESKEKYKIPDDFMNKEFAHLILGITFGKKGGGYHLALQNNKFIINGDQNSSLDEPFQDMEIKKTERFGSNFTSSTARAAGGLAMTPMFSVIRTTDLS